MENPLIRPVQKILSSHSPSQDFINH